MKKNMARLGTSLVAIVMAVAATLGLTAGTANAGEAVYKYVRVHNHAWYGLHFNMVYESDDAWIAGTGDRTAIALGVTWSKSSVVVDGARGIEFHFWIEAGKSLWYNAGTARDAGDYCFDTWGTTLSPQIYRTDCTTGAII